ncbi:MAG: sugar phosphate isomerase/epimerase family protein [Thermodesulfobacteriota bacterium]
MRYGAMNSPLRPLLREVEEIAGLGFDYLELTMDPPHAHHGALREHKRELLKALDRLGLALVCHLPTFVSTADLTESLREASIQETILSLRAASSLKPLKVVLHPSFIQGLGAMMVDQARQHAMQALDRILTEADRLALPVCVENLFPRSLSLVEPEDFDAVFKRFPAARLALDTGHAHIGHGGKERIAAFISRFSNRIGHVHASDNSGREDEHLPIGVGSVDFPRAVKALKGIGYDDTITLEVFSRDRDYLRISREKLAAMFAGA